MLPKAQAMNASPLNRGLARVLVYQSNNTTLIKLLYFAMHGGGAAAPAPPAKYSKRHIRGVEGGHHGMVPWLHEWYHGGVHATMAACIVPWLHAWYHGCIPWHHVMTPWLQVMIPWLHIMTPWLQVMTPWLKVMTPWLHGMTPSAHWNLTGCATGETIPWSRSSPRQE